MPKSSAIATKPSTVATTQTEVGNRLGNFVGRIVTYLKPLSDRMQGDPRIAAAVFVGANTALVGIAYKLLIIVDKRLVKAGYLTKSESLVNKLDPNDLTKDFWRQRGVDIVIASFLFAGNYSINFLTQYGLRNTTLVGISVIGSLCAAALRINMCKAPSKPVKPQETETPPIPPIPLNPPQEQRI